MNKVAVLNYGIGNLRSVHNALEHIGCIPIDMQKKIPSNQYDTLLIPGVGAFNSCVSKIKSLGFYEYVKDLYKSQKKIIGICVGHQMFYKTSEESPGIEGWGIYNERIVHLSKLISGSSNGKNILPNVGYRRLYLKKCEDELTFNVFNNTDGYFIHSYGANAELDNYCVVHSMWNGCKISAVSNKNNLISFQFHPERSREAGLRMLQWAINYGEE